MIRTSVGQLPHPENALGHRASSRPITADASLNQALQTLNCAIVTTCYGHRTDGRESGEISMDVIVWMVMIGGIIAYTTWWFYRTRTMVNRWAEQNRLRVLDYSVMPFPPYPPALVTLTTSTNQLIVRMRVYDNSIHRIRTGWLRLGTFWWGLLNVDAVEVFWADHDGLSNQHGF